MEVSSAIVGVVSGLLVMAVGKLIDYARREEDEAKATAVLLGELRAGFAGVLVRMTGIENRLAAIEKRIDERASEHNKLFHSGRN